MKIAQQMSEVAKVTVWMEQNGELLDEKMFLETLLTSVVMN